MNSEDIRRIADLLSQPQKIVIVPHKNPDGDAVGSVLGLWHYLNQLGQEARIIAPNDFPKFLKWMPGAAQIQLFEKDRETAASLIAEATIIFALDFNELGRTGEMAATLKAAEATFIMIDHHQDPGDFSTYTYSDVTMSSTCEMVYNFLLSLAGPTVINSDIARCLYTGILTDTGSFKFASTTSQTHRVAADLIDRGADHSEIHQLIFDTFSADRMHLLGCALNNLVILEDYRTAYITLKQEDLDRYNFKKGDTEGFVNYGLALQGISFAVIFIESREESMVKISFRSQGSFSVNEFARAHFEGGGHTNAAGGRSSSSLEDTVTKFRELLPAYKDALI